MFRSLQDRVTAGGDIPDICAPVERAKYEVIPLQRLDRCRLALKEDGNGNGIVGSHTLILIVVALIAGAATLGDAHKGAGVVRGAHGQVTGGEAFADACSGGVEAYEGAFARIGGGGKIANTVAVRNSLCVITGCYIYIP